MNFGRRLMLLRLSPYAYWVLAIVFLVIGAALHCACGAAYVAVFIIGFVWFIAARVIGWTWTFAEIKRRHAQGVPLNDETPTVERAPDEARVRAALDRLESFPGACPPWLPAAVDDWLAAPAGADKDHMRGTLLRRLYAEAAAPGDVAQRHALNDVRLAINPWVGEK